MFRYKIGDIVKVTSDIRRRDGREVYRKGERLRITGCHTCETGNQIVDIEHETDKSRLRMRDVFVYPDIPFFPVT